MPQIAKFKENIVHAFVECKLNKRFLTDVERILQGIHQAPTVTISINILHLLKIECKSHYNLILTLAFWSIYKLILERNKTGIDKRRFALKHIFQREISTRIDMQCNRKSNRVIIKTMKMFYQRNCCTFEYFKNQKYKQWILPSDSVMSMV